MSKNQPESTLIHWLGEVVSELRAEASVKQVHVASALDQNQTTLYRFEKGAAWPRDPELTVTTYAELLDVPVTEIWAEAIRRWKQHGPPATADELRAHGPSGKASK